MRKITLAAALVFTLSIASLFSASPLVYADGNGSPATCLNGPSVEGDPVASYDAGSGNIVNGVCIKSGSNMFGGNQHSGVLGNGTYETGCYQVEGVGTQEVTVTRLLSGPNCQGISHIDILVGESPGDDLCPNIDGVQSEVPDGLIIDNQGNCVEPPPVDVCPNIDGLQTVIPEGMVKDDSGNCVTPPQETPPVVLGAQVTAAPTGGVNAGVGSSGSALVAIAAAVSLSTLGLGLRRLGK